MTTDDARAEAWDEGWEARSERLHLKRGECVPAPAHINPYRREQSAVPSDHTATAEDAARVLIDYLDDHVLPVNYTRPVSGETHRAIAERCAPVIAYELDRRGLLATARTRPTREQIAKRLFATRATHGAAANAPEIYRLCLEATDAVLALLDGQPTVQEVEVRALEQAADDHFREATRAGIGNPSEVTTWLRERAAVLRAGEQQ